ncbi:unnamed protein product [Arabidopsis thaliana]|uniref:(thale cress) hypothetical protein n=1 Tax=Arabidopsis thaliana TaxID=3702 RepID=A0A7G2EWF4_ARATH|nr:unnamed protein product [Arabidopsis thaliana]
MGDPNVDLDNNAALKEEQDAQVGKGTRGDVTILPTLVVNNRQYRGKLEKSAVLKALCSGFEESTEPAICLSTDNNGDSWQDKSPNITTCKATFRGKVCVCPIVDGVRFKGDGYSHCERNKRAREMFNQQMEVVGMKREMDMRSLLVWLVDKDSVKCECPPGFKGDGVKKFEVTALAFICAITSFSDKFSNQNPSSEIQVFAIGSVWFITCIDRFLCGGSAYELSRFVTD